MRLRVQIPPSPLNFLFTKESLIKENFAERNVKERKTVGRKMECVFCAIVEGKAHSAKLGENKNAIAILDAFPIVEGHTLVIPKTHHKALWDFNKEELHSVFDLIVDTEMRKEPGQKDLDSLAQKIVGKQKKL